MKRKLFIITFILSIALNIWLGGRSMRVDSTVSQAILFDTNHPLWYLRTLAIEINHLDQEGWNNQDSRVSLLNLARDAEERMSADEELINKISFVSSKVPYEVSSKIHNFILIYSDTYMPLFSKLTSSNEPVKDSDKSKLLNLAKEIQRADKEIVTSKTQMYSWEQLDKYLESLLNAEEVKQNN